ncbi:MAG: DNA-formamidopyrimidine glycosylase family protein [Microbacterium sp.]|uniref:DNA-formamidopyrimidine glycosylase family protein n=1 Tax=Microbacterium sp. TaxID=51671 RepID=UPI0039E5CE12
MPEGDTVFRTAKRLNDALAGAEVARFDLRVPGSATVDLRGQTVHGVVARGKHILHRIGDVTLHSHLKMEGRWDLYRPGERWRRPQFKARAIVGVDESAAGPVDAVGFDLAMVEVVATAHEQCLVGHLGPDPLGEWDAAEAARRLASDPRPAHVALQDQRNIAGFGNEYANEILFVRGIHPETPATETDAAAIVDLGARMIRSNVARVDRTFTGDPRPGRTNWVHRREGRPCRRCHTPIRGGALGADPTSERIVFWCPRCQPR